MAADRLATVSCTLPEIAIALEGVLKQRLHSEEEIKQAASAVRLEIARDLHDTVAQDINFLRFKLDQLTLMNDRQDISAIRADLEKMHSIADESSELIRGILATLHPENQSHLADRILVNGTLNAAFSLEPRGYRLRLLNGSNARTYKLAWSNNMPLKVIGADGGLLPAPSRAAM